MDYMNLHQSAHGDREFGASADADARRAQDGRRARQRPGRRRADRHVVRARRAAGTRRSRSASRASATTCATSPSPRATRSRRRSASASRSTATASAIWPRPCARRSGRRRSTALLADYEEQYELAAELRPGGARRDSLVEAARIEAGLRSFLDEPRLQGVHRHVRGSARPAAAAGHRRAAADGRRLRLRRRGRLEGGGARPDPQGDGDRAARRDVVHGGLHLRPRARRAEGARRAHARDLPVDRRRAAVVRDPPAVDRRPRRSGPARLHGRARARRSSSAWSTSATGSG